MEESSTKELITQSALAMFEKSGYKSVSIRDIAKDVGIKTVSVTESIMKLRMLSTTRSLNGCCLVNLYVNQRYLK
ncbi:MAG: TetR family transcriptional regulator [Bacillota bacterium]|nr:TetR family transcriptional regulator [Bacillota bacterium]